MAGAGRSSGSSACCSAGRCSWGSPTSGSTDDPKSAVRRRPPAGHRTARRLIRSMDGIWITELEPAAGKRLAVKDLFDTAGIRTTYGSAVFADHVPATSAGAVVRLEAAGWVNAGKANLHEFAYGVTSQNLHYGVVPNPAYPGRTAGGSSGGSAAALALGLVEGALGTDTGGSIRIPAACCGIAGFKPSFGTVPIDGVFPLAASFDHAGPMARDVAGCVGLMQDLVPGFQVAELGAPRVGIAWTSRCDALVRDGCSLQHASSVTSSRSSSRRPRRCRRSCARSRTCIASSSTRTASCTARTSGARSNAASRSRRASISTLSRSESAPRARRSGTRGVRSAAVTHARTVPPPRRHGDRVRASELQFTFPFNALGWPALAIPVGLAEEGLPASVQIVGRRATTASCWPPASRWRRCAC